MRYVIDSRYFDGSCLSSMCDDTHSDYGRETLQELCERERNPFLVAVSPGKILFLMRRYIRMLCTPFREITREDYCNLFECVPPARMGRNWFFVGEAYFGDLYPFCFTSDGRYFKGERPVHLKDEAIWRMIGEHMKTLDFHPELVHGEPQVESDRWYNGDITVTPYYFLRDGKRMFIGNLISDTGQAAEDSRHRREMAERLLDLRRNHNWPATLKGLLQGQMVNDAGKLVVIEELMYAIVEANGKITQLFIFLFIMIISQYFFFRTLK